MINFETTKIYKKVYFSTFFTLFLCSLLVLACQKLVGISRFYIKYSVGEIL